MAFGERLCDLAGRLRRALPQGGSLPQDRWERRHRGIIWLLWLHIPGLWVFAILTGNGWRHALEEVAIIATFALVAGLRRGGRRFHAIVASLGLLTASAILVHLSGGYIEMHFHFFVIIGLIALYQDWPPFLIAIAYVVGEHGLLGVLEPSAVYNHPAAIAHPWWWALVHGAFVLGASVASILTWRAHEVARAQTELILKSAGEGIYGIDAQGNATFVNPTAARMIGWDVEELLGRSMHEILHHSKPDGSPYPADVCPISAASRDGRVRYVDDEVFWHKDGRSFPVEYVSTPIRDHGALVGAVVAFKDITERRRAEAARAERARAAALGAEVGLALSKGEDMPAMLQGCAEAMARHLDAAGARIWVLDTSANVLDLHASAGLPTPLNGPRGRVPVGQMKIGRIAARRVPELTNAVLDDDDLGDPDWARREGLVSFAGYPLTVEDRLVGVMAIFARHPQTNAVLDAMASVAVGIAQAIERRRAEEALRQREDQLRQSQKMEAVGRLAGGVAHDFNNLLTIIKGRSQMVLKQLPATNSLRKDIDMIDKTSDRAARVVEQLLAFSRKQILQPKVLDLNVVVGGMMDILRRLIGEDVELAFVPAPGLGRVRVDLGQLEQMIVNLAVNARDAMPDGGRLTIETGNVELDELDASRRIDVGPGAYVRLSVTDTGVGMGEQVKARLFEPFFTTKELGKGTGLGLATVYGIVEQSGGSIAVDSEIGWGTTFHIYLPRLEESADPIAERGPATKLCGGTETVLLVEDEDDVRTLTRDMLESLGYTVLEARRPREAMVVSEQQPGAIHLLVTDVVMPELNGHRLAQRVTSRRPEIKVLYMSGYIDSPVLQHGVLQHGTAFMQKPFSREVLARKVREVLDRTGTK